MDALRPYTLEIVLGLALLILAQWIALSMTNSRLKTMSRTVRQLLTGPEGADLETMLQGHLSSVDAMSVRADELSSQLGELSINLKTCVQNVGMVRFDAFGDVSGGQSFSVALLDGLQNGVVITGLFGRSESRCFGKSISNGQSQQLLSEEESSALEIALQGGGAQFDDSQNSPARGRARRNARAAKA